MSKKPQHPILKEFNAWVLNEIQKNPEFLPEAITDVIYNRPTSAPLSDQSRKALETIIKESNQLFTEEFIKELKD